MQKKVSENILDVLKTMEQYERKIAELYLTCQQIWLVDKEFWTDMTRAEMKHAQNMNRMVEIISEKPESFTLNPQFRSTAAKTAFGGIEWQIQRLRKKEITKGKMFYIARDVEQSLIESKYNEITETSSIEFQSLMDEIVSDTIAHRDQLNKKIEEHSNGGK